VRSLAATGKIPNGDLLAPLGPVASVPPDIRDRQFATLLALPELAKSVLEKVGPKQKPDRTRLLTELCQHVRERCGHWHDRLIADILNDLQTESPDTAHDEISLKQWRYEHGLKD
jgi:hypothetical protein